jgi:hypothetical protein
MIVLDRWVSNQHRRGVVASLRRFREAMEHDVKPESWTQLDGPMVLLLADVCDWLGLDGDERDNVLGREGIDSLRETMDPD